MGNSVMFNQIKEAIKGVTYTLLPDGRTTICNITLDNGFTVRGESSCVDIKNYDADIGNGIAYENAEDAVWKFLGFRLADKLHNEGVTL